MKTKTVPFSLGGKAFIAGVLAIAFATVVSVVGLQNAVLLAVGAVAFFGGSYVVGPYVRPLQYEDERWDAGLTFLASNGMSIGLLYVLYTSIDGVFAVIDGLKLLVYVVTAAAGTVFVARRAGIERKDLASFSFYFFVTTLLVTMAMMVLSEFGFPG